MTIRISIKLFSYLRDQRFSSAERDYPEGVTIKEVLLDLSLDPEEVGIIMINGRHRPVDTTLADRDVLNIFPVIGGG